MKHLGYPGEVSSDTEAQMLDVYNERIYHEVHTYLGLEFEHEDAYVDSLISREPMDEDAYVALYRFFKEPWKRSVNWTSRPLERSIELDKNVAQNPSTARITEKKMAMSGSSVHLSLSLTLLKDTNRGAKLASVPAMAAPMYEYNAVAVCQSGRPVRIKIDRTGSLVGMDPMSSGEVLLVDTTWLL